MNENPSTFWKKSEENFGVVEHLSIQAQGLNAVSEWLVGDLSFESGLDGFIAQLSINAEVVNYKHEVLSVEFGLDQYPVVIRVGEDVGYEVFGEANPHLRAEGEQEFLEIIAKIIGSNSISRVISTLEAMSKGEAL